MTSTSGYSGTPLAQKLGFKDGLRVLFIDLPETLDELATSRAFASADRTGWDQLPAAGAGYDAVHLFTTRRADLDTGLPVLVRAIAPDGMIWISWPKKASKVPTDITEDTLREVALPLGLVDIKVCAVDAVWSGLKLVIRKQLRHRPA